MTTAKKLYRRQRRWQQAATLHITSAAAYLATAAMAYQTATRPIRRPEDELAIGLARSLAADCRLKATAQEFHASVAFANSWCPLRWYQRWWDNILDLLEKSGILRNPSTA